ncbi:MAG: hypothetical protein KKF44_09105 [Nanoarchaeota archaeon]|nr:hypothetical protein [Nanoarchaeota archaeon]
MDNTTKEVVTYALVVLFAVFFIFTDIPLKAGEFSYAVMDSLMVGLNLSFGSDDPGFQTQVLLFGELVFAGLLLISPISLIGGFWFGKISYELFIGRFRIFTIFNMNGVNAFLGVLTLLIFLYSFFEQYRWIKKMFEAPMSQPSDKELVKFI